VIILDRGHFTLQQWQKQLMLKLLLWDDVCVVHHRDLVAVLCGVSFSMNQSIDHIKA
jgi:hypothetical protein